MINVDKGFGLIELLVVIGITGIITSMAVPAFGQMLQRNHIKSAALSLQADLQLARTLAIKQGQNILVSRTTGNAGAWCYGLAVKTSTKTRCDCNQSTTDVTDDCEIKSTLGASYSSVDMLTATVNNNSFDFRRGTISANGVTFATDDYAARVVFSDAGRVRLCTPPVEGTGSTNRPVGTIGLPAIPDCP